VGVGVTTIYQLISDGRLETITIGRRRLVKVSSIRRLVGDTEQGPE
jgi:excisionase family DNA binding protein